MLRWILLLIIFFPSLASAHGVEGEVQNFEGGIVVIANYDTGEPMSYASVEIYAPNSQIKFQSGRTDRNGHFAFVPDVPGEWQVIVDDGIGHRLTMKAKIDKTLKLEKTKKEAKGINLFSSKIRMIIGFLLIFGIFGWFKEFKMIIGKNSRFYCI